MTRKKSTGNSEKINDPEARINHIIKILDDRRSKIRNIIDIFEIIEDLKTDLIGSIIKVLDGNEKIKGHKDKSYYKSKIEVRSRDSGRLLSFKIHIDGVELTKGDMK
jgi:hypothetical protein